MTPILFECRKLNRRPAGRHAAQLKRSRDQRARLPSMNRFQPVDVRLRRPRQLNRPPARQRAPSRPAARPKIAQHRAARSAGLMSLRQNLKCPRQQRIADQNRRRLAKNLMARRPTAPQIVIIHRRQIVMHQRISMHHFNRTRRRQQPRSPCRRTPQPPTAPAAAEVACREPSSAYRIASRS